VGGAADHGTGADDLAGDGQRQVALPQVQYVGAGGSGDVGAVVDCEQRALPSRGVGQDLERLQFGAGFQRPELAFTG